MFQSFNTFKTTTDHEDRTGRREKYLLTCPSLASFAALREMFRLLIRISHHEDHEGHEGRIARGYRVLKYSLLRALRALRGKRLFPANSASLW
jgi:hypothetical protein